MKIVVALPGEFALVLMSSESWSDSERFVLTVIFLGFKKFFKKVLTMCSIFAIISIVVTQVRKQNNGPVV